MSIRQEVLLPRGAGMGDGYRGSLYHRPVLQGRRGGSFGEYCSARAGLNSLRRALAEIGSAAGFGAEKRSTAAEERVVHVGLE